MLTRSIDPETSGPTFDERLFRNGKRICVAFAIAAIGISALDLMNAGAVTDVAAAIRHNRLHYDELPTRLLAGIRDISVYRDRSFVVAAIPADPVPKVPALAALPRSAAKVFEPAPAPQTVARLDVKPEIKQRDIKADPKPVTTIKGQAVVAELSAANHTDAMALAMSASGDGLNKSTYTLTALPASMPAIETKPVVALSTPAETASFKQASLSAGDMPPVQVASLTDYGFVSPSSTRPDVRIDLPPLSMVPLPMPAPGVPPPSPAQRLNLEGKEYAKAERCLANAIYWEARSEPVRGQMAVAQVVMNRVFSDFYPKDVCGVVYQNAHRHLSCQFTFACDGKRKTITERGHWARANRIAKQTLDGQIYVPEVGKSTHYHASYVNPIWNREMKKLVKFGLHSFYRPYAWGAGEDMPVWGKPNQASKPPMSRTLMARAEARKK